MPKRASGSDTLSVQAYAAVPSVWTTRPRTVFDRWAVQVRPSGDGFCHVSESRENTCQPQFSDIQVHTGLSGRHVPTISICRHGSLRNAHRWMVASMSNRPAKERRRGLTTFPCGFEEMAMGH